MKILRFLIVCLLGIFLSIDFVFAQKRDYISQEKAWSIVLSDSDIKLVQKKLRSWSGGSLASPAENSPYYSFFLKQDECGDNAIYPVCERYTVYVDAYTGKLSYGDDLKKKIAEIKESIKLMEEEKLFKQKLEKSKNEVQNSCFIGKKACEESIKNFLPLFLEALNKITPDIRSGGVRILTQLASHPFFSYKAKEAIPKLLELLKDEDYGVRYEATMALASISEKGDANLIKAILPLIKDKDNLVRRGAIESLGKLGDKSLVPVFIPLLEDSAVNQNIVPALGNFGDESVVEPLIKLFYNKDFFYLERSIISALGKIAGNQAITFLVGLFDNSYTKDNKFGGSFAPLYPYMGVDAAKALANIGKDSKPYLIESLKSKDYLTRLYSVYALGLLRDAATIEILNQVLNIEEDLTVKTYLEMAIAEIQGKEFISPLLEQLKVWVEPSKKKYRFNEAIKICLYLQNKGGIPFIINTVPLKYADLALEIFDPEGKPLIYPIEFLRTTFPTKDSLITLAPGQVRKFGPYRLQDYYYQFDSKGKYEIRGIYSNSLYSCGIEFGVYALTGTVESEKVIMEIE